MEMNLNFLIYLFSLNFIYLFWISKSPSFTLLMMLLSSFCGLFLFYQNSLFQIHIFMVLLIMIGGLFVLISFVILSIPKDYDKTFLKKFSKTLNFLIISWFFFFSKKNEFMNWSNSEMEFFSSQILCESSSSFIFLIFLLLLMLKLVDSLMELSKKKIFKN